jgi:hypothetical protein
LFKFICERHILSPSCKAIIGDKKRYVNTQSFWVV